ncbi:hypothetical protein U1Q18_051688 [Sarracenia purpurea var. burkii]
MNHQDRRHDEDSDTFSFFQRADYVANSRILRLAVAFSSILTVPNNKICPTRQSRKSPHRRSKIRALCSSRGIPGAAMLCADDDFDFSVVHPDS